MGPEQERLGNRLFGDPEQRAVNFSITLGDNPGTPEDICAEVNRAMDQLDAFRALPVEEQMRAQMTDVYGRLCRAIQHCKFTGQQLVEPVDDARERLSAIFGELDISLLTLGNWIDQKERKAAKASAKSGYPK